MQIEKLSIFKIGEGKEEKKHKGESKGVSWTKVKESV